MQFSILHHATIVSKRNKFVPSPPLVQCCFAVTVQVTVHFSCYRKQHCFALTAQVWFFCVLQQTTTLFCLQIIKEMQRCTNILYTDQLKLDTSVVCFELFLGTRTVFWQSLKMSLKKIRSRSFMIFWVLTCCVVWRQMSWKEFLPRVSSLWEWNWVHSKSELKLLQSSWLI